MAKTEVVGVRIRSEIAKWLETYEKASGKNTSELIRDMLEASYKSYRQQQIDLKKRVNRISSLKVKRYRILLAKIGEFLSNSENVESLLQSLIGFQNTLKAWGIHFDSLANQMTGEKVIRKRRVKKGLESKKGNKETGSQIKPNEKEKSKG